MSWLRAASARGDDVFDEDADEMSVASSEWASNMRRRIRDGYVDGADAGREASLQAGFNQGYREGAALAAPLGRLKGTISALYFWYQTRRPEGPVPPSVTELLHRISQCEDELIEGFTRALGASPPDAGTVSETMEDLDLRGPASGCGGEGCGKAGCCARAEQTDPSATKPRNDLSSGSPESLDCLLQRCISVVSDLGLPQELIQHLEELKSM